MKIFSNASISRAGSVLLAALAGFATPGVAAVYTWTDENGVVHYSDQASAPAARPARFNVRTLDSGTADASSDNTAGQGGAAGATPDASTDHRPRIVMPEAGATIDNALNQAVVAVELGQPATLADNETLIYQLDGRPLASVPETATRLSIDHLGPGPHTLSVELAVGGRPTGREDTVQFVVVNGEAGRRGQMTPATNPDDADTGGARPR